MKPITEEQGDRLERAVYDTVYARALNQDPWGNEPGARRKALHVAYRIGYDSATDTEVMIAVCEVLGY